VAGDAVLWYVEGVDDLADAELVTSPQQVDNANPRGIGQGLEQSNEICRHMLHRAYDTQLGGLCQRRRVVVWRCGGGEGGGARRRVRCRWWVGAKGLVGGGERPGG